MGHDRKTFQLCKQVEQTLNLALAGEVSEEVLRDVAVASVEPAPDQRRLLVTVEPINPEAEIDERMVLAALGRIAGRLRSEVAASIHRRKTPQLAYRFVRQRGQDVP